jgi:hypothetical protein
MVITPREHEEVPLAISVLEIQSLKWWLGFSTMEVLARDAMAPISIVDIPLEDLVELGWKEEEAREFHETTIAFLHIQQKRCPSKRSDGKPGQHFNLTQIPSEVGINPKTGLALYYHVAIHFEKPNIKYTPEDVMNMIMARLAKMDILLGKRIRQKILVKCNHNKPKHWIGVIKFHLLHPEKDGVALLHGIRPYILLVDH